MLRNILILMSMLQLQASSPGIEVAGYVRLQLAGEPTQEPIPNAQVRLFSLEQVRETTTGRDGAFAFEDLPAGEYNLEAFSRGFKPFTKSLKFGNIEVQTSVNVNLIAANQPNTCNRSEVSYSRVNPTNTKGHLLCSARNMSTKRRQAQVVFFLKAAGQSSWRSQKADSNGKFEFVVEPGSYTVKAACMGFNDQEAVVFVPRENNTDLSLLLIPLTELLVCQ